MNDVEFMSDLLSKLIKKEINVCYKPSDTLVESLVVEAIKGNVLVATKDSEIHLITINHIGYIVTNNTSENISTENVDVLQSLLGEQQQNQEDNKNNKGNNKNNKNN